MAPVKFHVCGLFGKLEILHNQARKVHHKLIRTDGRFTFGELPLVASYIAPQVVEFIGL